MASCGPTELQRIVFKYTHEIKASGHLGVTKKKKKKKKKVQQRYYWPGLQNDVRTYVAGCEKCAKEKDPIRTKQAQCRLFVVDTLLNELLGRVAQSVGHLTRKSGVLGSIPGLATYFRFSFRFFKKGSCQLLAKVCARSTG